MAAVARVIGSGPSRSPISALAAPVAGVIAVRHPRL